MTAKTYGHSLKTWNTAKDEALAAMTKAAKRRGMITYTELAQQIEAIKFHPHDMPLHAMLGECSTDEAKAGRGMISVVVVHKRGDMEPGAGFYALAEELGRPKEEKTKMWVKELHLVHDYWSNKAKPR